MSPQLCAYFYILCHRYCRKHILIAHHHINDNEGYTQFFTLNENSVLLCRKVYFGVLLNEYSHQDCYCINSIYSISLGNM